MGGCGVVEDAYGKCLQQNQSWRREGYRSTFCTEGGLQTWQLCGENADQTWEIKVDQKT